MRLGLFCNFYPGKDRLGTHSTSLALLLLRADPELALELVVPRDSKWPSGFARDRVGFHPVWAHDDLAGLLRGATELAAVRGPDSARLFNWFPTCFGQTRAANALGMLLPALERARTRSPVAVYAHNFIETQAIERLGYHPGPATRLGLSLFETILARVSQVIVPLESQRKLIQEVYRTSVTAVPLPFVEALFGQYWSETHAPGRGEVSDGGSLPPKRAFRVLIFGVWGPQKDIDTTLPVLSELFREGASIEVLLAGTINRFFPQYRDRITAAIQGLPPDVFRFVANPPDEIMPELFGSSDLVLLPYNAIAGPSGVMGLAAFYGTWIVAYDVPELREYDAILGGRTVFVPPKDRAALKEAIRHCMDAPPPRENGGTDRKLELAAQAARKLLAVLRNA